MKSIWLTFPLGVGLVLIPLSLFAQIERANLISSDEMLQYTLNELKNRLQDVVKENSKLSARNNALRKRMLSFRQDMREFENHKLNLMERNNDLKDFLNIGSQEYSLTKKKIRELREHDSFSNDVSGTLAKTVEQSEAKYKKLQSDVRKAEAELAEAHQPSRSQTQPSLDDNNEKEKSGLLARIQKIGVRNRALEKQLPDVRNKMAGLKERKKILWAKKSGLKSQIQSMKTSLEEASSQEEEISSRVKAVTESQDQATQDLKAQVQDLSSRYEAMNDAAQDSLAAEKKVRADLAAQEMEVKMISNALSNENALLQQKRRILLARLRNQQDMAGEQIKAQEDEIKALTGKLEPLQTEQEELKNKIAEQERQEFEFKTKETALRRDIAQFSQDIEKVLSQGEQSKEGYLKSQKIHLAKLLNDYKTKTEMIKKQIADRQKQKEQLQQKIEARQNRQKELEDLLKKNTEELTKAEQEESGIREESNNLASQEGKAAVELKREIETLELRKTVLMSSLEAIKNKYHQDQGTIKEFVQGDQKALQEYWDVLKAENLSLKDKALSVGRAVQQLERQ